MSSAIGFLLCNFARLSKNLSPFLYLALTLLFSSQAIAQNIDEVEPNNTLETAQDITASFSRVRTLDILHSAFLPSVSITATGDDTADYYKVTVDEVNSTYIFDIDYARNHGGSFDSNIALFNSSGGAIVVNEDFEVSAGGQGSASRYDSYIKYKFTSTGIYYLKVRRSGAEIVTDGGTYTLQISKENASFITDADDDGMSDEWETFYSITDPYADSDADGYSNLVEFTQGSDPSFADSDNDGIANADDDDDDNDGVLDINDAWPTVHGVGLDADADGHPDVWHINCDNECIQATGLLHDQFPQYAGAWLDADLDGLVDAFNDSCTVNCAIPADEIDGSIGDYDNDGLLDGTIDDDDNGDGFSDIDADSDGLVEISSLNQLNAMRHELYGKGLKLTADAALDSSGCPVVFDLGIYQQRCSGYELTQSLNFDTNSDGQIDSHDAYWNVNDQGVGEGWEPIGNSRSNFFSAHFNGGGHIIKNLTINRPMTDFVGLFGFVSNSVIENVVIAGLNSKIIGKDYVAVLVGNAESNTQVRNVVIAANVQGGYSVAGLVGFLGTAHIESSFVSGSVSGNTSVGGLVGRSHGSANPKSSIRQSLSLSSISGNGSTGGLIATRYNTDITNSYWARDISGQSYSSGRLEANSYVGLNLTTLQCAIAENTDSTSGCVSSDGSVEGLRGPVVLYKDWDSSIWDFGTVANANQQLPGLKFNGQVVRDSDGDGVLDADDLLPFDHDNDGIVDIADAYPSIAIGELLDTDADGIPNECDQDCIDAGMIADIDNDNDGVIDEEDFYPLIAVGSLDTDRDGIPNDCNQACLDLGMVADTDDDNDGVLDGADFYPLISLSGALDSDGDGIPDECNQACLDSGMVADTVDSIDSDNDGVFDEVDAFASNPAASIDDDNDGQPDRWNDACLAQCQAGSGLVKDPSLSDTDNDGATNDVDSDFENDNGKPTLLTVPETVYAAVNTANGSSFIVDSLTVDSLLSQLTAVDFVDDSSVLTAKVYLNDVELVRNEDGEITLPSGLLALSWVAVDLAGNESEPLEQKIYVYPQVRFKSATSITGEASQAEIIVELTGDSPEYPVSIDLTVNDNLSSIDQADLNDSFDLAAIHTVVIEAGDDAELLNREASLIIPIIEDGESENDELLVIEFPLVVGDQDYHEFIVVSESQKAHELTVTYQNLAPSVQLLILQDEQAVTSIAMDGGVVTLLAIVSDGNGLDEHTYSWDLDGLTTEDLFVSTITFEPSDFAAREYLISVTVTDNASNPLSGMANQKLTLLAIEEPPIIEPPVIEPPVDPSSGAESSGGSSGGGAMAWMLLLLMTLAALGQYRRYIKPAE